MLAEGGVAALAVEPLAARGGSTKGSVYWHFATRDALLRATLDRWEAEHTAAVIAHADRGADPAERLRLLFEAVLPAGAAVELALHASLADPLVAAAVARVGRRRVGYLAEQFTGLGFTAEQAHRRAVITYSAYLGQVQLLHGAPETLPHSAEDRRALVDDVLRVLLTAPAEG
ncbi:Transcriptional regulator, TetR family [Actinokineospora spheciospongiae]|uniref:Transcriptional regulator, TetR family n=1 Tax=Actinokineospora spheciospongiae TaxID=909613 RepID=W7J232_9PSEU|nr:Transcriptional regulator, TetR family [Actinokineospora spheciospongiae]